jgi:exonuclease V gamma subunit
MLHLHLSDCLEGLAEKLLELSGPPQLFKPNTVIVPGAHLQDWLKRHIAKKQQIFMGWEFKSFESFLATKLKETDQGFWLKSDQIQMAICDLLTDSKFRKQKVLKPLDQWLKLGSQDLRLFQMASNLTGLFTAYELENPDLLRHWENGRAPVMSFHKKGLEEWQACIWTALMGPKGGLRKAGARSLRDFADDNLLTSLELGEVLHVFDFDRVFGLWQDIVEKISSHCELNFYSIDNRKNLKQFQSWQIHSHRLFENLTNAAAAADLQEKRSETPETFDSSNIEVLACSSMRREVEVICNKIWQLVAGGACDFSDIAVVLPQGPEEDYQRCINAVFEENNQLPFEAAGGSEVSPSSLLQAFELLLDLPKSQYNRDDLLTLLVHPNFKFSSEAMDAKFWIQCCDQLSIYRGQDSEANRGSYIKKDVRNWEQGLRRLALGLYLNDEAGLYASGEELYAAHSLDVEEAQSAARLVLAFRSLKEDGDRAKNLEQTASAWADLFSAWFFKYFEASGYQDESDFEKIISTIHSLNDLSEFCQDINFEICCLHLKQRLQNSLSGVRPLRGGAVTIANDLTLGHLPFEFVFLAGRGDGCFPSKEKKLLLNLLNDSSNTFSSSADREVDLFAFRLLTKKSGLCISYVAEDQQNGQEKNPAQVLDELLVLAEGLREKKPPLWRGENCDGFPEYNLHALNEQRALKLKGKATSIDLQYLKQSKKDLKSWLALYEVTEEPQEDLEEKIYPLTALSNFLQCPMQAWAKHLLQLPEERWSDPFESNEPLSSEMMDATQNLREIFRLSQGENSKLFLYQNESRFEVTEKMATGVFLEGEFESWAETLDNWDKHLSEADIEGPFTALAFGKSRDGDDSSQQVPGVELKGKRFVGCTGLMNEKRDCVIVPVATKGAGDQTRHFIKGFTEMMVLTAEGLRPEGEFRLAVIDRDSLKSDSLLHFKDVSCQAAKEWLELIVEDMFSGPHEYLLPIEAVNSHMTTSKNLEENIETRKKNPRGGFSSRYGPVDQIDDFSAVNDETFEKLYRQRYHLFFDSQIEVEE